MTFQDLLNYEENCVKEAMALPNLEVTITEYATYSDCEICGAYSSLVLEVEGDLGSIVSGDYAGCLSSNADGSYYEVAQWLNERLEEYKRPVPVLLTTEAKDKAEEDFHTQLTLVDWDYDNASLEPLGEVCAAVSEAFDAYYSFGNIVKLYSAFGVTISGDSKADEIYDASDWDRYESEEEEECLED